jgi:hemoglobin-like flavoprotein
LAASVSLLVLVVDNLSKPETLNNALKGLGIRHVKYGVLPQHYPMVGGSLLKTFAKTLETDWTPDVEKAWQEAYQAVAEIMLEGADYSSEILKLSN